MDCCTLRNVLIELDEKLNGGGHTVRRKQNTLDSLFNNQFMFGEQLRTFKVGWFVGPVRPSYIDYFQCRTLYINKAEGNRPFSKHYVLVWAFQSSGNIF